MGSYLIGSTVLAFLLLTACSSVNKEDKDKILVQQNMAEWCNAHLPTASKVLCYQSNNFVESLSVTNLEYRPFINQEKESQRVARAKVTHIMLLDSAARANRLRSFASRSMNLITAVEHRTESGQWRATLLSVHQRPKAAKRPVNGQGKFSFSDGKVYHGSWKLGKMHGKGIMQNPDGTWVKGEWQDGVVNGYATLYAKDSSIIEQGYWEEGLFVGNKPR